MAKPTVSTLAQAFSKKLELWQDSNGETYATLDDGTNVQIKSTQMRRIIFRHKPDGSNSTRQGIIDWLDAHAVQGKTYKTYKRISNKYFDLGDRFIDLRTLEIKETVEQKFIRNAHTGILPIPNYDGSLDDLTSMLPNIPKDDYPLLKGALVSAMKPESPHFIFCLGGPAGSAKTTTQRMLTATIDPRTGDWDSQTAYYSSRDPRDLDAVALSRWILSLDNLWTLSPTISDKLAVYSTGGEIASRRYYTNRELDTISLTCPIFLNGIGEIVTRPDLLSRSIIINCEPIEHIDLPDLLAEFYSRLPKILGGLLRCVQRAILRPTKSLYGDRMAGAVSWIVSAGINDFEDAYLRLLGELDVKAIEMSPVGSTIQEIIEKWLNKSSSNGVVSRQENLRNNLHIYIPENCYITSWKQIFESHQGEASWPRNETAFSNATKHIRQNLNNVGYDWSEHTAASGLIRYVILGRKADIANIGK